MDKKWNLQDIKPAEPRKKRTPERIEQTETASPASDAAGAQTIRMKSTSKNGRKSIVISIAVFALIVSGGLFISYLTAGAEVTVFPKHRDPNVNTTVTAYKTPQAGELSFEVMSLEAQGERQVTATGQEEVQEQATGVITIYNETDSAERLIKNTRFESPDGKIFKITESVRVPAGTETSPGTVTAEVFADAVGEEYNIAPTTFTIPGYNEGGFDELYEKIYAESSVAFSGGFDGPKFILDESELETAENQLKEELQSALLDRVDSEKPAGFVVFDDAIRFTFTSLPAVEYGDNMVTIKLKGELFIPIFKEDDFASYIAAATVPGYENNPVRIDDISQVQFTYAEAASSTQIASAENVAFQLRGNPRIVWTFDAAQLTADLAGAQKTALPTILGGYPSIEKAEAVVRPFWKRSFPDNTERITITEVLEDN